MNSSHPSKVLVVDLDETLLKTDLLHEALLVMLKSKPWNFFKALSWLVRGKAYLKTKLAEEFEINAASLPYRNSVIGIIEEHKKRGDQIILATASPKIYAEEVARHLGCFDEVLSTTDEIKNLKGKNKLDAIRAQIGDVPFSYVGDSNPDLVIWQNSRSKAYAVNPNYLLEQKLKRVSANPR